jgi:N-acetylneuraminate synthase/N,N'-diacetyllegionaminate synthase
MEKLKDVLGRKGGLFFIAEIGGNHEGDFEYAQRLMTLGIASGTDALKFQLYKSATLVNPIESPERSKHFKKFELSRDQYTYMAKACADAGVMFMASVWDPEMLGWIDPYISMHKVGAGDLTNFQMIKKQVETGKPLILSTGLAEMDDVKRAVDFVYETDRAYIDDKNLALLQCTSTYPCPDEDANVAAMVTLRDAFGLPVGYSDHTVGTDAIEAAVAMGACIIEKHFTDDRAGKIFRDHQISLTCDEVRAFLQKARKIKTLLGSGKKEITPSEKAAGHHVSFRRALYARRDLREGECVGEDDIVSLRPEHGLPASEFYRVVGRKVTRDLKAMEALHEKDIC